MLSDPLGGDEDFRVDVAPSFDIGGGGCSCQLSPTATVDAMPQLEIYADDVKCTHGATVGQLDEQARFYLRSRGIPEEEALGLLTFAFANEIVEGISIDALREQLESMIFERFGSKK